MKLNRYTSWLVSLRKSSIATMLSGRLPITLCNAGHRLGDQKNFQLFDDGSYLKITRITDLRPTAMVLNHPFHTAQSFYYEGKMTKGNNAICLGLVPEETVVSNVLFHQHGEHSNPEISVSEWDLCICNAWPNCSSYTYHACTGKVWNQEIGTLCGPYLKVNDIIGCGYNCEQSHLYFTVNGEKLEHIFKVDKEPTWYPITGFKGEGAEFEVNLGKKPFAYQPAIISARTFPQPESFSEEWTKHIDYNFELGENLIYDHLKDVTILSKDGHKIKCHGIILSIRSKVFQVMLEPTKNVSNIINIKDFDAQTIKKMLSFIYSDKAEEDGIDMDLLGIANMYQVEALQIVCERILCNELDVNNVLDAWVGANLFKRSNFVEICESFIISHWLDIQKTASFSRLMQENCEDIASLMFKMLNVHINSKEKKNIGSRE